MSGRTKTVIWDQFTVTNGAAWPTPDGTTIDQISERLLDTQSEAKP